MSKVCDNCKQTLKISRYTKNYVPVHKHISQGSNESEAQLYLFCDNVECDLKEENAFWDLRGNFFSNSQIAREWANHNSDKLELY